MNRTKKNQNNKQIKKNRRQAFSAGITGIFSELSRKKKEKETEYRKRRKEKVLRYLEKLNGTKLAFSRSTLCLPGFQ